MRGASPLAVGLLLALVVVAVGIILVMEGRSIGTRPSAPAPGPAPGPSAYVRLSRPRGEVPEIPYEFAWEAAAGASEYKITISDEDAVWPLLVRKKKEPSLTLTAREAAAITPGRIHVWEVLALGSDGLPIATGGVRFRVTPSEPALPVK